MADAVVAGHICLDIIPDLSLLTASQFENNFRPGRLIQSGPAILSPGGAVSNTGLALNRLGINTQLVGKVGADQLGSTLRNCLAEHGAGLDEGIITSTESSTSYSIVISLQGIDRRFIHHPGANDDFCADDIEINQIKDAKLFHFGYPPLMKNMYLDDGRQLKDLLKKVQEAGLVTSLDMAFPDPNSAAGKVEWRAILRQVLPYVDIFVPSIDEILFMLSMPEPSTLSINLLETVSSGLLEMGTKMVLLKLGDQGLYLRTGNLETDSSFRLATLIDVGQWSNINTVAPCFEVDVMGTTGSGDVTVAGFLAALLNGSTPMDSLTFALGVGACNVETPDVLSGILSWDKTWERINSGWKRKEITF